MPGVLHDDQTRFSMGRSTQGTVRFTPDGELGFAVQEDGSIGVFELQEAAATAVLAVPLTASMIIVLAEIPATRPIAILLSASGRL